MSPPTSLADDDEGMVVCVAGAAERELVVDEHVSGEERGQEENRRHVEAHIQEAVSGGQASAGGHSEERA